MTVLDRELAPTRGPDVCSWIESALVHGEGDFYGDAFVLRPWQRAVIYRLYELVEDGSRRRYDRALIGLPKGNGKTELLAALALYELLGNDPVLSHGTPDVPIAAASFDQAELLFGAAKTIVTHERCPLREFVDAYDTEILRKDGLPGRLYRVAAAAGTNDGRRPSFLAADELHEWTDRKKRVHVVLVNGLAKRSGSLGVFITTAGAKSAGSVAEDLFRHGIRVRSGEVEDDGFLFIWWTAPESLDLDNEDDLRTAIEKANPAAGDFLDVDRLVRKWQTREVPEYEFRRYHLNQWTSAESNPFIPAGIFEELDEVAAPVPGTRIWSYFDGSHSGDASALRGAFLLPDSITESEPSSPAENPVRSIPRVGVFNLGHWEASENDREWRVPRNEVDVAVAEMMRTYEVARFGVDPWGWFEELEQWVVTYGDDVVVELQTRETKRWSEYCDRFYSAAVEGRLAHEHDGILERHLRNAVPKETTAGTYVQKEKRSSRRRIDALIASIGAHGLATEASDYESQEVRVRWI